MKRFIDTLPPLPANRQKVYSFYRLELDNEGIPCKRLDDGRLVFHPLLGAYYIIDYLRIYQGTKKSDVLDYVQYLADTLIGRADPDYPDIVFTYDEEDGLSSVPGKFYSALTQSWYIKALGEVSKYLPGRYVGALQGLWGSLLRPLEDGGVLAKREFGWVIEEYPHRPAFYTLNGWITALTWIIHTRRALEDAGIDTYEFIERNLDAVEHLLPLYDAPFVWNSRYQLTGFTRIRFTTGSGVVITPRSLTVRIPGEDPILADMSAGNISGRWATKLERSLPRLVQFNIVLSMAAYPAPSRIEFEFETSAGSDVRVEVADGDYRPDSTAMPTERWIHIETLSSRTGTNRATFDVPFNSRNMFAYPTNFKKIIDGKWHNSYHYVHIVDLAELYGYSKRPLFKEYALRWIDYIEHWSELPLLDDPKYSIKSHASYGDDLELHVKRLFRE